MQHADLDVQRHTGGKTVQINLVSIQTFRLDEELMPVLVWEFHHLVFDRRTVARTNSRDLTGIKRRAVNMFAYDPVDAVIGMDDVTTRLRQHDG